jgi:hypothetical protein
LWSWLVAGQDVAAVHHDDETGLLADEELLDHHAGAVGVVLHAELVVEQHPVHRLVRLVERHGHDHALARRQPVRLDDDGRPHAIDIGMRLRRVAEGLVGRRGNLVALHEVLGEGLGAFELRGRLGRAEDAQTPRAELVHHARRQRHLGADHRHADLLGLRKVGQRGHVRDRHIRHARIQRRATVARRHEHLVDAGGLGQLPSQCMFTATAANHENFHRTFFIIVLSEH